VAPGLEVARCGEFHASPRTLTGVLQRVTGSRAARWIFLAVALALAVVAMSKYWDQIRAAAVDLHWLPLGLALVCVWVAIGFSLMAWRRMLAELGSPLPLGAAVRVFALSQLGKYIPGSIWPFVAQVELGREHGVPRKRSAAALVLVIVVNIITACLVAALTLPFSASESVRAYWWGFAAAPILLAGLHPAVLNPLLDRLLRLARREPLDDRLTGRGIIAVITWCLASWITFGVHVWILALNLGGSGSSLLLAATGGYALAWTAGFLFVIAPAGAGVREFVLALTLSSALPTGPVVLLVIASRLLITVADVIWAALGVLLGRAHASTQPDVLAAAETIRHARPDVD
jgi:hypothetical protein